MTQLGDSNAVRSERMLAQHQAALTLIQARVVAPLLLTFRWLDLACGRGQLIATLERQLSESARAKIEYTGFDVDNRYLGETRRIADGLSLKEANFKVGDLSDFPKLVEPEFNFITLVNTVHEVSPDALGRLVVEALQRLTPDGILFVYDMEQLTTPELGAVPWTRDAMMAVMAELMDVLGCSDYLPEVSQWPHSSVNGWNVQIDRSLIGLSKVDLAKRAESAIAAISAKMTLLLQDRLEVVRKTLEALTVDGVQTPEEERDKIGWLHEFWAVSRALEAK